MSVGLDGKVYGGERHYLGERSGRDVFESRLWRISSSGKRKLVISPTRNAAEFNIAEFLVARDRKISLGATRRCLARRVRHRTGIDNQTKPDHSATPS